MQKSIIFVAVLAIFALGSCCKGDKNVPEVVKAAFAQKFPDATKVIWEQDGDTQWEAEFKLDGKEFSADFTADGKWIESDYEVSESDIPEVVKQILDSEYVGFEIEEVEYTMTASGDFYEFELEKDDIELEVTITPEGMLVKGEAEDDEDEDED